MIKKWVNPNDGFYCCTDVLGKQLFQPLKRKLAGNETRRAECSLLPGN